MKRCFLLNGTYITEPVPRAAPLRACGLPDAVFLAISATSACRDLHLEGEEGGGERRFSSTALPPVPEVADSGLVNTSLLRPPHRTEDALNAQGFSEVVPHHVSLLPFANTSGKGCFRQPWKQARLCQSPRARCKREADRQPPSAPCYQQTSAATLCFILLLTSRPPLTQQPGLQFLVCRHASGPPPLTAPRAQHWHDSQVPQYHKGQC